MSSCVRYDWDDDDVYDTDWKDTRPKESEKSNSDEYIIKFITKTKQEILDEMRNRFDYLESLIKSTQTF